MNKWTMGTYAILLSMPLAGWPCGSSICNACPDGISVSDQASVKVTPDAATIVVSVESTNEDVDVACQKNTDSLAQLKAYLSKEGVKSVETDPPIVEARFSQNYSSGSMAKTPNGYSVRRTLTAQIDKIAILKPVSSGVLTHGAANILAVQLRSSELEKAKNQSRQQALEKAKARALEIARQVGQPAGLVTNVEEVTLPQVWSTFSTLSSQRSDFIQQTNLLLNAPYGIQTPNELPFEGDKIVVSSTIKLCMEFKDLAAREKMSK